MKILKKSWKDISINDYYEILNIMNSDQSAFDKQVDLIAYLSESDKAAIYSLPLTELSKLNDDIKFLQSFKFNDKCKFTNITIKKDTYKVNSDLTHFTIGQYIDFQTFWTKNDMRTYIGNILACFLVPKKHKYGEGYDVVELAKSFRDDVDIITANELIFFFLSRSLNLMVNTLDSLKHQIQKTKELRDKPEIMEKYNQMRNDILNGLASSTMFQKLQDVAGMTPSK